MEKSLCKNIMENFYNFKEELAGVSYDDDQEVQRLYRNLKYNNIKNSGAAKEFHRQRLTQQIKKKQKDVADWAQMGMPRKGSNLVLEYKKC